MKQILCEILQVAVSYWYVYFSFKLLVFSQGNTFKLTFKKFQLICSHKIGNSCLTFRTKYMLYVMLDLVRICSSKESFDNFCIKCSLIKFNLQNKRMINVFLRRFFFFCVTKYPLRVHVLVPVITGIVVNMLTHFRYLSVLPENKKPEALDMFKNIRHNYAISRKRKKVFFEKILYIWTSAIEISHTEGNSGNTNIYCIAISKFSFTEELS